MENTCYFLGVDIKYLCNYKYSGWSKDPGPTYLAGRLLAIFVIDIVGDNKLIEEFSEA